MTAEPPPHPVTHPRATPSSHARAPGISHSPLHDPALRPLARGEMIKRSFPIEGVGAATGRLETAGKEGRDRAGCEGGGTRGVSGGRRPTICGLGWGRGLVGEEQRRMKGVASHGDRGSGAVRRDVTREDATSRWQNAVDREEASPDPTVAWQSTPRGDQRSGVWLA